MEDSCRNCVFRSSEGNCTKIPEEFKVKSDMVSLLESGEFTEYLEESGFKDFMREYMSKFDFEGSIRDVIEEVVDQTYRFLQYNTKVELKIDPQAEFKCKYWR